MAGDLFQLGLHLVHMQGRKKMFFSGGADVICALARGEFLMTTPTFLNHAHYCICFFFYQKTDTITSS